MDITGDVPIIMVSNSSRQYVFEDGLQHPIHLALLASRTWSAPTRANEIYIRPIFTSKLPSICEPLVIVHAPEAKQHLCPASRSHREISFGLERYLPHRIDCSTVRLFAGQARILVVQLSGCRSSPISSFVALQHRLKDVDL